jgi:hypothetical protein
MIFIVISSALCDSTVHSLLLFSAVQKSGAMWERQVPTVRFGKEVRYDGYRIFGVVGLAASEMTGLIDPLVGSFDSN